MAIAVIGAGRSGTNMVLEILRGSPSLNGSKPPENLKLFRKWKTYGPRYLTKCDSTRMTWKGMKRMMNFNPTMFIVWTIRDPRDMMMSKLRRGAPFWDGGDCPRQADDGTILGALDDIRDSMEKYKDTTKAFPDRTILCRMENALRDTEEEAQRLCDFCKIEYDKSMPIFWKRMRLDTKAQRYQGKDMNQIGLWKHWKDVYDGWLLRRFPQLEKSFAELKPVIEFFNYD